MRVLFLCTGNSARSILGEYLLRELGEGRFETMSAGAAPTGRVHPMAQRILREDYGIDAGDARSQPLSDFDRERLDLVITVCDHARDTCPIAPENTLRVHWGSPDPAAVRGEDIEVETAFREVARVIETRVRRACAHSLEDLSAEDLVRELTRIGEET